MTGKKCPTGKKIIRFSLILAALLFCAAALDHRLIVRSYTIEADKITSPVRIALITDLHSCRYGEKQAGLINAVSSLSPDLILMGGDIFDHELPNTNTEYFLEGIAGLCPAYFVTGNHEYWSGPKNVENMLSIVRKNGITVLSDECETIPVNGQTLNICGVNDPIAAVDGDENTDPAEQQLVETLNKQLLSVSSDVKDEIYTVLLSHRPEHADLYSEYNFDLVLCGHAHGGQWRIPGLINGLFAPGEGIFPRYAGGRYDLNSMTMIVSRGLARESTPLPRIFNRPELVVIDLI